MNSEQTKSVIDAAATAIEHSRWNNRLWYLAVVTGLVIVALGLALWLDKGDAVVPLCWLTFGLACLCVVTPSAEQAYKMLQQVSAIRAGVKVDG